MKHVAVLIYKSNFKWFLLNCCSHSMKMKLIVLLLCAGLAVAAEESETTANTDSPTETSQDVEESTLAPSTENPEQTTQASSGYTDENAEPPTEDSIDGAESPAEEAEAPTEETEAPTEETEAPTEDPEALTEDTEAPTEGTEAPTEDTEAPTEDTETPTEDTESPTEDTEAPTEDTEAPTEDTEAPTEDTEAPTEDTEAPTEETEAPTEGTEAPTEDTEAPTEDTEAPTEGTEAPTEDTEAPTEDTEAPTEDTEAPTEDTEAPTEDTEAPTEDTEAPAEDTEAPTEDTEAPTEDTEAPTEDTEAPTEDTEAPTEDTEAPTEDTEAPTEDTEAPTEDTEAPTEDTEAPTEDTEAPTEDTEAPTEDTEAPTEDTEAPTEDTEAPTEGTEAPTEDTEAPTEETEAPTEDTEAPTEDTEATEATEKPTTQAPDESTPPIRFTENGLVMGRTIETPRTGKLCDVFSCIRYAEPPIGSFRFWNPRPVHSWSGVYDATSPFCPVCPQPNQVGSEDCLFLSIFVPRDCGPGLLKVIIHIHPGGFKFGSGNQGQQSYMLEECVIVITLNYRLGALGFLALNTPQCSGNYGVKDVRLALKWIKTNIKNFGGDPNDMTVMGVSAGSAIAAALFLDKQSCSLFTKVILQSGTATAPWAKKEDAVNIGHRLAFLAKCYLAFTDAQRCECLRKVSPELLVQYSEQIIGPTDAMTFNIIAWGIVVEKSWSSDPVLLEDPFNKLIKGDHCGVPVVIGVTKDEGCYFSPEIDKYQLLLPALNLIIKNFATPCVANSYNLLCTLLAPGKMWDFYTNYLMTKDELIEIITHTQFHLDTILWVKTLAKQNNEVYFYLYECDGKWAPSKLINPPATWVCHADHLPYEFYYPKLGYLGDQKTDNPDLTVSKRMVALWANFAKTGCPTIGNTEYLEGLNWPAWTESNQYYCSINFEISIRSCFESNVMRFWNDLYNLCCNTPAGPSPYPVC